MPNPFGTTFESLESPAGPIVDAVHDAPYRRLLELIESGEGQLISLRAPRAGFGKTMLLSRIREKKKGEKMIVAIHLADGRRVDGEGILEELLTQLTETVSGAAGLTRLDLHARRLFAHGLLPLVYSGEVPSQDKDGALASLRDRPTEAFDFHHDGAAIAQWTKSQFEVLSPRLSSVLSKSSGASGRDTSYWTELFFKYAIRTPNEPNRTSDLMDAVFGRDSRFRSGAGFLDGLGSFLNLITLVEPVVLVLDEVDGLSSDSDSALRATSCLVSLWESAPRTSVVVSVNDDVWQSAFAPRLPLGLRDRLEDVVISLEELTREEAEMLVAARAGDESEKVLAQMNLDSGVLYPRGVLKAAREAWDLRDETPAQVVGEGYGSPADEFVAPESSDDFPGGEYGDVVEKDAEGHPVPFGFTDEYQQPNYPPQIVRRASIPRRFDVQRIRQSPSIVDFAPAVAAEFFSAPPAPIEDVPAAPDPVNVFQGNPAPPVQPAPSPEQIVAQSPFEPSGPPVSPELAPSQPESPFESGEPDDRRSLRSYPSNSPFEPAPVQEQPQTPEQHFTTPPPYPQQATPPPLEQHPAYQGDHPFESAPPAQSVPPQPEAPKVDADAIDELLRQFREHRDS